MRPLMKLGNLVHYYFIDLSLINYVIYLHAMCNKNQFLFDTGIKCKGESVALMGSKVDIFRSKGY